MKTGLPINMREILLMTAIASGIDDLRNITILSKLNGGSKSISQEVSTKTRVITWSTVETVSITEKTSVKQNKTEKKKEFLAYNK